jgi:hypothetical protein
LAFQRLFRTGACLDPCLGLISWDSASSRVSSRRGFWLARISRMVGAGTLSILRRRSLHDLGWARLRTPSTWSERRSARWPRPLPPKRKKPPKQKCMRQHASCKTTRAIITSFLPQVHSTLLAPHWSHHRCERQQQAREGWCHRERNDAQVLHAALADPEPLQQFADHVCARIGSRDCGFTLNRRAPLTLARLGQSLGAQRPQGHDTSARGAGIRPFPLPSPGRPLVARSRSPANVDLRWRVRLGDRAGAPCEGVADVGRNEFGGGKRGQDRKADPHGPRQHRAYALA